ncbi:ABC transporter permease [Microbacterium sp.]|uniref:ABC transporter permease n=1 Tax=Microbacterium sp. TaxID=51671 RepID=UPI003C760E47
MSTAISAPLSGLGGGLWRNTLRLGRNRASLVSAFVIPGIIMLAFWVVFGHAASQAGIDYALFLLPAAMFQAAMFTAGGSAMAFAVDQESGILNRLRAMPISATIIVASRLGADLIRSVSSLAVVTVIALLCGARPDSVGALTVAFLIALLTGEILAMLFCGLSIRSRHPVATAGIIQGIEMPFLMLSTAFIPAETLPDWLRPIVVHQPFSPVIDTMRAVLGGTPPGQAGWEACAWLLAGAALGLLWVTRSLRRIR